ncbi:MAG: hypothetical protein KBA40_02215 [Candidatus Peribacteraceae bacterium]|nr:hypothetical protein [Candidatus Peribacteraceae bacterium]MBP9850845.1 hypothetical protein [Candidatus Peribacteraceae bacterium]
MKKTLVRLSAVFTAIVVLLPSVTQAQTIINENSCFERVASELVDAHDEWRSRLFGSREDADGKFIALTAGEVDAERTGIFETKNRLTSEFIEPLVESYRVYRCRSLAVCEIASRSIQTNGGDFDLHLLGCAEQLVTRYGECYFGGQGGQGDESAKLLSAATNVVRNCQQLVTETLASERAVLRLAVAYDSGYRSLLQLAGMVDWMLEGFPTETVKAVSDMVNMLGKLHQIPCFIGQCDHPKTDDLAP